MRYFSVCLKKAITPKVFIMLLKSILALIFSVTTTVLATIERNDFINEKFDLLISYYDVEKAILLKITHNSKAQFKVGFSSVDKRLNHLMINTNAENYKVFVHELFRYLKILNRPKMMMNLLLY